MHTYIIFAWPMQLRGHHLENKPYATLPPVLSKISRPAAEKSVDQRIGSEVTAFFCCFMHESLRVVGVRAHGSCLYI